MLFLDALVTYPTWRAPPPYLSLHQQGGRPLELPFRPTRRHTQRPRPGNGAAHPPPLHPAPLPVATARPIAAVWPGGTVGEGGGQGEAGGGWSSGLGGGGSLRSTCSAGSGTFWTTPGRPGDAHSSSRSSGWPARLNNTPPPLELRAAATRGCTGGFLGQGYGRWSTATPWASASALGACHTSRGCW